MRSGLKANSHVFNYYHLELAYFQALYTYGTSQVMDVGRRHHCHLLKVVLNVTFQNISLMLIILFKVHIFSESHKILQNLHLTFEWHKSKVKISKNFVAFSEYMNFKTILIEKPTKFESQHLSLMLIECLHDSFSPNFNRLRIKTNLIWREIQILYNLFSGMP